MAITPGATSKRDASPASTTFTYPTGTTADDYVVCLAYTSGEAVTLPNFTRIGGAAINGGYYLSLYGRVVTGSPTSETWSAGQTSWVAQRYTGVDTTDPLAGTPVFTSATSATFTANQMTTDETDPLLIYGVATWDADGTNDIDAPASMTLQVASWVDFTPVSLATQQLTGSGATGSRAASSPYGSTQYGALLVALSPAGGGAAATSLVRPRRRQLFQRGLITR